MKSMTKAIIAILLVVAMIATFIACSKDGDDTEETTAPSVAGQTTAATTAKSTTAQSTTAKSTTAKSTTAKTTAKETTATTELVGGLNNVGADTAEGWGTMSP